MKKYKKIITLSAVLAMCALTQNNISYAVEIGEGMTFGDWTYKVDYGKYEGGYYAAVSEYNGTDTDIVVPEEIDGIPVKYINKSIFENLTITSVVMPSTIFNPAFGYHDLSLKKITFLGDTIELDGYSRNLSGSGIEELVFPNVKGIYNGFFRNCKNLKKVVYGGTVSKINGSVYEGCTALTELDFLDSTVSVTIDNNAFANTGFVNLEFSPEVTLKDLSFDNCQNLETITFKNNVKMTGTPFSNCPAIKSVEFNGDVNMQSYAFKDCTALENLSFDTSKDVNGRFFEYCTNVKYINNERAFDETTGDFNPKYKDFIIKSFGGSDDVGFLNEYVTWHVRDVVDKYTDDNMSDMEKIKVLHDWICENISYSIDNASGSMNHNDLAPFLTGNTVCDGYARAFNLLANEAGIETYYVRSNNHIWNVVKLGSHYFHVDTTWDDGESSYNWFLKSDDEMRAETSSHSYWELKTPSSLHSFQKDTLPECTYPMGDCNTDGDISVADIVKMDRYLLGADAVNPDDFVLYDLDFSGDVDVFDMIEMRGLIAENSGELSYKDDINLMTDWLLGKTDCFNPEWDFNGDGDVDIFDLIILRQNLS